MGCVYSDNDIYGIEKYLSAACSDRACVKLKLYNSVKGNVKVAFLFFEKFFGKVLTNTRQ